MGVINPHQLPLEYATVPRIVILSLLWSEMVCALSYGNVFRHCLTLSTYLGFIGPSYMYTRRRWPTYRENTRSVHLIPPHDHVLSWSDVTCQSQDKHRPHHITTTERNNDVVGLTCVPQDRTRNTQSAETLTSGHLTSGRIVPTFPARIAQSLAPRKSFNAPPPHNEVFPALYSLAFAVAMHASDINRISAGLYPRGAIYARVLAVVVTVVCLSVCLTVCLSVLCQTG